MVQGRESRSWSAAGRARLICWPATSIWKSWRGGQGGGCGPGLAGGQVAALGVIGSDGFDHRARAEVDGPDAMAVADFAIVMAASALHYPARGSAPSRMRGDRL
jgi:hypothetical protein